ncbi:unnamed protein product [Knipowitschia caucasica]
MKAPLLFALLFTTVLCRPARKYSVSSSESSEEMGRPSLALSPQTALVSPSSSGSLSSSPQHVSVSSSSDESSQASEEQVVADVAVQVKSAILESLSELVSATASTSVSTQSPDSVESDDDDDDDDDEEEDDDKDEGDTEESESSESGEASTVSTATDSPVIVTEDVTTATVVEEMTPDPISPTIVTDNAGDSGRGDSLGSYPSEYKSIVYVEDKSYHKEPETYKSWDYVSKKSDYEPAHDNDVHKAFKLYKGVHVHQELLEEGASTPEVESQSLDTSSRLSQDLSPRQASADMDSSLSHSSSSGSTSDSSGTTEEEGPQAKADSISSSSTHEDISSASAESPEEESPSQSSEEAITTPGAADSQSDESDSDESLLEEPVLTTDLPLVITAK